MIGTKNSLLFFMYCVTVCLAAESATQEHASQDIGEREGAAGAERPVGRAYSVTTCDYRTQIGYTCLSCNRALHCYPGNVAILVDCYGIFRYCRDGRCSRHQGDKCLPDTRLTTPPPSLVDTVVVPDTRLTTPPGLVDAPDATANDTTQAPQTTAAPLLDNVV